MAELVRTVSEEGSGVVLIDAAGTASWAPPVGNPNAYIREIAVISPGGAVFSVLTGHAQFSIGTGVAGSTVPFGRWQWRLVAATITSGSAYLLLS